MLKPDRFSCSQKIQLKWDPPVLHVYKSVIENILKPNGDVV